MRRINRIELMRSLQMVEPGLAQRKELVEQSKCFVFKDGEVITFNDEIACRSQTKLKLTGAVPAKPLLALLNKLAVDEVDIELKGDELSVGKGRQQAFFRLEKEITLPIDSAEKPGTKWLPIHDRFAEAVDLVQECAGRDESKFAFTCVHLTPKWIEATDDNQLTRFKLKTGVRENCLIRRDSIKHVTGIEVVEFNETDTWIHFRNSDGLVMSCRRYLEEYPELDSIIDFNGTAATLPKKLGKAAEIAEVFTSESENKEVRVDMRAGKARIMGVGSSGYYREISDIDYTGPNICFMISPKLLKELTSKYNDCEISDEKMKIQGDKWVYVASLGVVEVTNGTPDSKKKSKKEK